MEQEHPQELTVDDLPARLGFVESEEMVAIHRLLHEAHEKGEVDKVLTFITMYQVAAQDAMNQMKGIDYEKGQIALLVVRARLSRELGRFDDYEGHLDAALTYALYRGHDDIVAVLDAVLDEIWS
jgi:hypothetical protein